MAQEPFHSAFFLVVQSSELPDTQLRFMYPSKGLSDISRQPSQCLNRLLVSAEVLTLVYGGGMAKFLSLSLLYSEPYLGLMWLAETKYVHMERSLERLNFE